MKKNLLVTLADKNYVDQAKQLFSSVYFNAGWKGDYMLLSHEIPQKDLKWFRDKGILIRKCKPVYNQKVGIHSPIVLDKFYLFTEEFKRWETVVFLDADIIVRASLDRLKRVNGFNAVGGVGWNLSKEIDYNGDKLIIAKLTKDYNPNKAAFNSGVFAFNTKIIGPDTYSKLMKLFNQYKKISLHGDQLTLNLFFYGQWKKLPQIYNMYVWYKKNPWKIRLKNLKGILLHFVDSDKPWTKDHDFYKEWKYNFERADLIDLEKPLKAKKWNIIKRISYSAYLRFGCFIHYEIDRIIGLIGIFLTDNYPRLYSTLKRMKI